MDDEASDGLTVAEQMTLVIVLACHFERPAARMRSDGSDPVTSSATELVCHVRAVAEARDEDAMQIHAVAGLREGERRVEERHVCIFRRRRVEIPSPAATVRIDEN